MRRDLVTSSTIESIGYDEATQTLEIEFKSGAVYQYFDVPDLVYRELMSAASHGQFLAHSIKGSYRYSRV